MHNNGMTKKEETYTVSDVQQVEQLLASPGLCECGIVCVCVRAHKNWMYVLNEENDWNETYIRFAVLISRRYICMCMKMHGSYSWLLLMRSRRFNMWMTLLAMAHGFGVFVHTRFDCKEPNVCCICEKKSKRNEQI